MEDNLYIISWNVTRRCNLRCTYCYLPSCGREGNFHEASELNTEEALLLIDQIASVNPETMLILSGGEPLLRTDIFKLAGHASGKGMTVVLGSNGLLIDNETALKLKQNGVSGVSIGLDSVDPAIHDRIRSFEGAWEKAVNAINVCKAHGLSVQINTVVTKNNYDEIPELIEYSKSMEAKVYSPFFLVCTGRGEELTDITPEQYEKLLSFLAGLREDEGKMMIRPRCAPTFRRILYQSRPHSPLLKMNAGKCMAGLSYCRITPEGNITPCPYMPLSAGNIRERNFAEIWNDSDIFASLRTPSLKGKCGMCEFRLICGGCRARAFASSKDLMGEDPWCAFTPMCGDAINPPAFRVDSLKSGQGETFTPMWTLEAEERLKRVPAFVRFMVKSAVERYAVENDLGEITPAVMKEARNKIMQGGTIGH